ncbi:MAG: NAD-dependent epimerase/dehydratase family protein [Firmicutes bacterium]|nr:NAD-dependent epimerase/dehydratase family protein [Bacillota bacterium]
MSKKVYIVTGGTGFVGNNLAKELDKRGEDVVVLARSKEKFRAAYVGCQGVRPRDNLSVVYGGVLEPSDLDKLFACAEASQAGFSDPNSEPRAPSPEYIFIHTASIVYLGNDRKKRKEMYETNIEGTKNVIDACLKFNARLVYVSSVEAIAAPKKGVITETTDFDLKKVKGHYAKTKAAASRLVMEAVKDRGLDAVIVHPAGIVGPNDFSETHTTQIAIDYKAGNIPASTSGGYQFVDVRDVVDGTIAAAQYGKRGEAYLLSNRYYSVSEMLDTLHELGAGKKIKKRFPLWVAKFGLPFMTLWDKLRGKTSLYSSYSLMMLGVNSDFSHEKATRELVIS